MLTRRRVRAGGGQRVAPRRPTLILALGLMAGGTFLTQGCRPEAPWEEYGPPGAEARIQALAVDYILTREEDWSFSRSPRAVCVGIGRWVTSALNRSARDDQWNPEGVFFRFLDDQPWPVYPMSECAWGRDGTEILREEGGPAVVLAVHEVAWQGPKIGQVRVEVQESTIQRHSYVCEGERASGLWELNYCLFRW